MIGTALPPAAAGAVGITGATVHKNPGCLLCELLVEIGKRRRHPTPHAFSAGAPVVRNGWLLWLTIQPAAGHRGGAENYRRRTGSKPYWFCSLLPQKQQPLSGWDIKAVGDGHRQTVSYGHARPARFGIFAGRSGSSMMTGSPSISEQPGRHTSLFPVPSQPKSGSPRLRTAPHGRLRAPTDARPEGSIRSGLSADVPEGSGEEQQPSPHGTSHAAAGRRRVCCTLRPPSKCSSRRRLYAEMPPSPPTGTAGSAYVRSPDFFPKYSRGRQPAGSSRWPVEAAGARKESLFVCRPAP